MPNEIYFDNGTNFHSAENELKKVMLTAKRPWNGGVSTCQAHTIYVEHGNLILNEKYALNCIIT